MVSKKIAKNSVNTQKAVFALLIANSTSLILFALRVIDSGTLRYWFLVWNLVLAWVPLIMAMWLSHRLKSARWLTALNILITFAWLVFLPNSFYLVSDLIHLQTTPEVSLLYDAVLFSSFIFNGFLTGFLSLYLMHLELIKRLKADLAGWIIAGVIMLSSFAIYVGRVLRWNSWDVIFSPLSLVFDISEQVVNDAAQSRASVTTLSFFVLIGGMYLAIWQIVKPNQGK